MPRTLIVLGVCLAALMSGAAILGGTAGAGLLAGGVLSAAVATTGMVLQLRIARTKPAFAIHALVLSFGTKFFVLVSAALCFVFAPGLKDRLDPLPFFLAFAGVALILLAFGSLEVSRLVRGEAPAAAAD